MNMETIGELSVDINSMGPQGLSTYEIYLQNGGTLNELDWLKSLIGPQGPQGPIGPAGAITIIKVDTLPNTNINTNAIYLMLNPDNETDDIYNEYMYIDNKWEKLGGAVKIDLSEYAKTSYVQQETKKIDDKLNKVISEMMTTEEQIRIIDLVDGRHNTNYTKDEINNVDRLVNYYVKDVKTDE